MRKFNLKYGFAVFAIFATVMLGYVPAFSAQTENYDSQHTMLALNMAIVSVHKIIATQDRVVLEQEYQDIVNNLSLGNIKSDPELISLYSKLLDVLKQKRLRQEEIEQIKVHYKQQAEDNLRVAFSNINISSGTTLNSVGDLLFSCVSSYFSYKASEAKLRYELNTEMWQLKKEDIEDFNDIQKQLFSSSWTLCDKYHLSDEYRLTQKYMDRFYQALEEQEVSKRIRMLRALEGDFRAYPPYWFYRAKATRELGNIKETEKNLKQFEDLWRPVLRKDVYKLEVAKYRVQDILKSSRPVNDIHQDAMEQMKIIRDNTPSDDWVNNVFAGIVYFLLGERSKAIDCIQPNVDFKIETKISEPILEQMKTGELNLSHMEDEHHIPIRTVDDKETIISKDTTVVESKGGFFSWKSAIILAGVLVLFSISRLKKKQGTNKNILNPDIDTSRIKEEKERLDREEKRIRHEYYQKRWSSVENKLKDLGREAVKCREKKGLTLEDIYDRTRIRIEYIQGIESGNYEGFPEPVYTKGFIRTYLRLIEAEHLLDEFICQINRCKCVDNEEKRELEEINKRRRQLEALTKVPVRVDSPQVKTNGDKITEESKVRKSPTKEDIEQWYRMGEKAATNKEAIEWYQKAAEYGLVKAQYNLGYLYLCKGNDSNHLRDSYQEKAYMWFYLASLDEDKEDKYWEYWQGKTKKGLEAMRQFSISNKAKVALIEAEAKQKFEEIKKRKEQEKLA